MYFVSKRLRNTALIAYKPAYKENLKTSGNLPTNLKEVAVAWPELLEYIKAAIKALVEL